jgi:hypothetical protein
LKIGYPDEDAEMAMVRSQKLFHPFENMKPVTEVDEIVLVKNEIKTGQKHC